MPYHPKIYEEDFLAKINSLFIYVDWNRSPLMQLQFVNALDKVNSSGFKRKQVHQYLKIRGAYGSGVVFTGDSAIDVTDKQKKRPNIVWRNFCRNPQVVELIGRELTATERKIKDLDDIPKDIMDYFHDRYPQGFYISYYQKSKTNKDEMNAEVTKRFAALRPDLQQLTLEVVCDGGGGDKWKLRIGNYTTTHSSKKMARRLVILSYVSNSAQEHTVYDE
uniref:Uncharacterized protein n=1 Tax=viral metagenome TaxID=1070528 RepID=A0A2V0R9X2_9ZZZZ